MNSCGTEATAPIVFVDIGGMNHYKGTQNDRTLGGHSYPKAHDYGHEAWNFLPTRGIVYGYVPRSAQVRLSAMLCSAFLFPKSRMMTKQQFAEIDPSIGSEPPVPQLEDVRSEGNPMGNDGAGDGNPTGNDGAGDGNPTGNDGAGDGNPVGNDGATASTPVSASGWRKL
jgi:hypothetical protein